MGLRRRRVNRRRRHGGWLTLRGRVALAVVVAAVGFLVLGGGFGWFGGPRSFRDDAALAAVDPLAGSRNEADDRLLAARRRSDSLPAVSEGPASPMNSSRPLPALGSEGSSIAPVTPLAKPNPRKPVKEVTRRAIPAMSSGPPPAGALFDPPRTRDRFEGARLQAASVDPSAAARLVEWRSLEGREEATIYGEEPLRVEYSLDEDLTGKVFEIMRRGRVEHGTAIVIDPRSGRLLAYVATDDATLPPEHAYPAASIVKVLTAAAMLEEWGPGRESLCLYRGNKYRLNRRRLERPDDGTESSLETALASSNNQCFAQWALHSVGEEKLLSVFQRFGWLAPPAPGHFAGEIEAVESDLDLGRLGSGLDGVRVTPLHVAQLGSILTLGEWVEPWWIDRLVDSSGRSLTTPERLPNRRVLSVEVAERLRTMMVATTKRGTARSAFRDRRGRPLLGSIDVAGKTGNLSGRDPHGRYEWFFGLAPAEDPVVAVAVLQLQGHMWWRRSTELGSDVLRAVFCDRTGCDVDHARRVTGDLGEWSLPVLISDLEEPPVVAQSQ